MKPWILAPLFVALALPAKADDGKIVFASEQSGNRDVFAINPDGSGLTNLTESASSSEDTPCFSPDGRKIALVRDGGVWTMNADGSGLTSVINGHSPTSPSFKPNSPLLTYSRDGASDVDIFQVQPDGGGDTLLINNSNGINDNHARWNGDGSKVAFYNFASTGSDYIYLANADGGEQTRFTLKEGRFPSWSPDGGKIVFQSHRSGHEQIYVVNADGSGILRLTNNTSDDTVPVFSPDGSKIAFISNRDGSPELYVMNADGTNPVRLTQNSSYDNFPSWQRTLPANAPAVSIGDVTVAEGNTSASFPVTLSAASTSAVTVTYTTYNGTAVAGQDFTAVGPATLTFAPGQTSKTIAVPIKGDAVSEGTENFYVRLSALGASLAKQTGIGTITDSTPLPTLNIAAVTKAEGNSGSTTFNFPVTLSSASAQQVMVGYTTSDGSASAGSDYTAKSGMLTISAGQTSGTISVSVTGDAILEANETFLLKLSNPVNAKLGTSQVYGTITNDDVTPGLSISDASAAEGDAAVFTLSLSHALSKPVTVSYSTADGTANAGLDYTAVSGTATITAGQLNTTVTVPVLEDDAVENTENFFVNLSNPTNAVLTDAKGVGSIANTNLPNITVGDVTVSEGKSGQRNLYFTIALSEAAPFPVSVNAATADGSALAGSDYVAKSGTVTMAPGELSQTFAVPITGDTVHEADETFLLNLTSPINGAITDGQGKATIINDDAPPTVSVSDLTVTEGDSGKKTAYFTVTLSAVSSQTVTLHYATANGSAAAGSDYAAASGTLGFSPGETSRQVPVAILGDKVVEGDETFFLNLSAPVRASIADGQGQATITNDDAGGLSAVMN